MIFNNENTRIGLGNFVSADFFMINRVKGNTYTDEPLAFLSLLEAPWLGRFAEFLWRQRAYLNQRAAGGYDCFSRV